MVFGVFLGSAGIGDSADFQKGFAALKSGNYATALREFTPLAEQGHAHAQSGLGWMYEYGNGVPKNHKTAIKWYKLAMIQGSTSARTGFKRLKQKITQLENDKSSSSSPLSAVQEVRDAYKKKDAKKTFMHQSELPICPSIPQDKLTRYATWTDCFGIYTDANGDKYAGEWKDGKKHGQFNVSFRNGDKYVGKWKGNTPQN